VDGAATFGDNVDQSARSVHETTKPSRNLRQVALKYAKATSLVAFVQALRDRPNGRNLHFRLVRKSAPPQIIVKLTLTGINIEQNISP